MAPHTAPTPETRAPLPYTAADGAALYDLLSPWDATRFGSDRFYDAFVDAAEAVLDLGCGTGSMLRQARERGHRGRLVGLDPDPARPVLGRAPRLRDTRSARPRLGGADARTRPGRRGRTAT